MPTKRAILTELGRELRADRLVRAQKNIVRLWHEKEPLIRDWEDARRELPLPASPALELACEIARVNTYQWHEEDKARDTAASDALIAQIKRAIDKSNQRRVDAIEALDSNLERLLEDAGLERDARLPLNSETPGSLVDRISILILKLYHMAEQRARPDITPEQRLKFSSRLKRQREQLADLSRCLDDLVREVFAGKRRFKTYYQFKMYNDPETNPFMRKGAKPAAP